MSFQSHHGKAGDIDIGKKGKKDHSYLAAFLEPLSQILTQQQ